VLKSAEARAVGGDKEVRQALGNMVASAQNLKHAQEHAADQLNRIVPYLQERAQGLSDITQLTGKQVGQILQSLMLSERALKTSAEHSEDAIKKLSSTADGLGERLFGAVNLLQASGKVLAETTEKTQSRLDEAIGKLVIPATPAPAPMPAADNASAPRIGAVVAELEAMQVRLKDLLAEQTEAARVHIDLLTTQSNGLLTQTLTASQSMMSAADRLRDEETKLDLAIAGAARRLEELVDRLEQEAGDSYGKGMTAGPGAEDQNRFRELGGQIALLSDKLTTLGQGLAQGMESLRKAPAPAASAPADTSSLSAQLRDQWFQMAAQIEATRTGLAETITQQIARVEARLAQLNTAPQAPSADSETLRDAQQQMEQQTQILTELVATLGVLDAHMQDIRSQVAAIKAG
jgi:DNA repair exonuclease SbcCD ATPase subunit